MMDADAWFELCTRSLGVPDGVECPRLVAARLLVEAAGQPCDLLSIGAAEVAIDTVTSYGAAGTLVELLLQWEQATVFEAAFGEAASDDLTAARATVCAKALVGVLIAWVSTHPLDAAGPLSLSGVQKAATYGGTTAT